MAIPESIKQKANKIRNEVYGKDVREALASGIEEAGDIADQANTKSEYASDKVENIQQQVNQLVVEGDSSVEAAQARVDADGNAYTTLKERLDTEHTEVTAQLADIADSRDIINVLYPPPPLTAAKNDGTSGQQNVLQAIFEYAHSANKSVYLPKGTYICDDILDVTGLNGLDIFGDGEDGTVIEFVNHGLDVDSEVDMKTGFFCGTGTGVALDKFSLRNLKIKSPNHGTGLMFLNAFNIEFKKVNFSGGRFGAVFCGTVSALFESVRFPNSTGTGKIAGLGLLNLSDHPKFYNEDVFQGYYWNDTISIIMPRFFGLGEGKIGILDHGTGSHFGDRNVDTPIMTGDWEYLYAGRKASSLKFEGGYVETVSYPIYILDENDNEGDLPLTNYSKSNFPSGYTFTTSIKNMVGRAVVCFAHTNGSRRTEVNYNYIDSPPQAFIEHSFPSGYVTYHGNYVVNNEFNIHAPYGNVYKLSDSIVDYQGVGYSGFAKPLIKTIKVALPREQKRIRIPMKFSGSIKTKIVWGGSSGNPVKELVGIANIYLNSSNQNTIATQYLLKETGNDSAFYNFVETPGLVFETGVDGSGIDYVDICVKGYSESSTASKVANITIEGFCPVNYVFENYSVEDIGDSPTYLSIDTISDATDTDVHIRFNELLNVLRTKGLLG